MYGHLTHGDYKLMRKIAKAYEFRVKLDAGGIIWIDRKGRVKKFIKGARDAIIKKKDAPEVRSSMEKLREAFLKEFGLRE